MAAPTAADRRNYGALGTTRDVGLIPGFADTLNDVVNLLVGGAVGHVHNHGNDLSICRHKAKAANSIAALAESLSCLYCPGDWLRFCTSAANANQ
jgi:hypothetical protein